MHSHIILGLLLNLTRFFDNFAELGMFGSKTLVLLVKFTECFFAFLVCNFELWITRNTSLLL